MNKTFLKMKAKDRGMSLSDLAKSIKIDHSTMYRKLRKGESGFSVAETKKIIDVLRLSDTDVREIFFK